MRTGADRYMSKLQQQWHCSGMPACRLCPDLDYVKNVGTLESAIVSWCVVITMNCSCAESCGEVSGDQCVAATKKLYAASQCLRMTPKNLASSPSSLKMCT